MSLELDRFEDPEANDRMVTMYMFMVNMVLVQ